MNVTPRAIPTLAFVLLAALATACGVEGGGSDAAPATTTGPTTTTEPDTPTTTKPDGPTTTKPGTIDPGIDDLPPGYEDQVLAGMIDAFVQGGLTQEQAECLADTYGRDILGGGGDVDMSDQAGMMQYFTDCGVNPMDLGN